MLGSRLTGIAVVTLVECTAVYAWLRLDRAGEPLWGIVSLAVGEMLETGLSGLAVRQQLRRRRLADGEEAAARRHQRAMQLKFAALSVAELPIWVLWLWLADEVGQPRAAVALLVLMHVKHHLETVTVRDRAVVTGLFARGVAIASFLETAGAVGCLALIRDGHPVLAAAALVAGIGIEHAILLDLLRRELATRDIRVPRILHPVRPRPGLDLRLLAYAGGNFPGAWRYIRRIEPLQRLLNRLAINQVIGRAPYRPEPLSTMSPYTSWASLTDRTYSGRHLPPVAADDPADVGAVADLFRRDGAMTPCPKSTVLFTCFAQWFTDGFLRTQRDQAPGVLRDTRRNESNHNVDLAQLYGLDAAMTAKLRTGKRGLLKSRLINGEEYPEYLCRFGSVKPEFKGLLPALDFERLTYAGKNTLFAMGTDTRNLGFAAFNVLFLREHNRIARELGAAEPGWDDERLFATARNILTVVLLRIVVEEYINHINASHFEFSLRPSDFRNAPWQRPNWMAVEFNLLYRWHSLVPSELLLQGRRLRVEETLDNTPALTDVGLGEFMAAASSQPAGRIGLFNTDEFLVGHAETPSIQQGRVAELAPYNDYRKLCRLAPIADFAEISTAPRVQQRLRDLYRTVHEIEFYVGLFAEQAGPNDVLPPLMAVMVGFDAFSQVLTNPLVAPRVYTEEAFSAVGLRIIAGTSSISQLVHRNIPNGATYHISLTRQDYVRV